MLGLVVVERWSEPDDAGVVFGVEGAGGTALLEFGRVEALDNGAASVQLRVADMKAFLTRVGERWPFDGPHPRPWGSLYTYLTDPNGVRVIVYAEGA